MKIKNKDGILLKEIEGTSLSGAYLSGANLYRANLSGANLSGANLSNTVLDPNATLNTPTDWPEIDEGYAIGYRTREAGHIDKYRDGRFYSADFFSVCTTECHPGLYLWPTLRHAKEYSVNKVEIIKVRTKLSEIHQAGNKYRCRWFEVVGSEQ